MSLYLVKSSSVLRTRQGFKSLAHSESPLKWTLILLSRVCFQTSLSESDPPKSPLAIPLPSPFLRGKPEDATPSKNADAPNVATADARRLANASLSLSLSRTLFFLPGTLTQFSPLKKGGRGGSGGLKTHPSLLKRTLAISPEINFRAGFGSLPIMVQEVR
jgi:hypothetical protein